MDDYNLCLNDKEETCYRVRDGCKSTIDLSLVSNVLAPELTWKKEYDLRGSDHFSIILKETEEITHGQQHRWIIKNANWIQYQMDSKLEITVHDQNTIEEAYRRLIKYCKQQKTISQEQRQERRGDQQYHGGTKSAKHNKN